MTHFEKQIIAMYQDGHSVDYIAEWVQSTISSSKKMKSDKSKTTKKEALNFVRSALMKIKWDRLL